MICFHLVDKKYTFCYVEMPYELNLSFIKDNNIVSLNALHFAEIDV